MGEQRTQVYVRTTQIKMMSIEVRGKPPMLRKAMQAKVPQWDMCAMR